MLANWPHLIILPSGSGVEARLMLSLPRCILRRVTNSIPKPRISKPSAPLSLVQNLKKGSYCSASASNPAIFQEQAHSRFQQSYFQKPLYVASKIGKYAVYTFLGVLGLAAAGSSVAAFYYDFNLPDAFNRTRRTAWAGIMTTFQYKWFYATTPYPVGSEEYEAALHQVHLQAAKRVLDVCLVQEGLYIKVGQYAASNNHIYPKEWTDTLKVLQDQATHRNFQTVEEIFRQEFGQSPKTMFAQFEENPVAAASIAQVHKAVTHDGKEVAVKIQYPEIRDRFVIDMFSHDMVLHAIAFFFPKLDMTWAGPELEKVLVQELDFGNEARNANLARVGFKGNKDYYIPTVLKDLSTDRILVTEWIDGAKINDVKRLREMGLDIKEVMTKFTTCLAEQLFLTGFLHADPHPGNVFVRKHPTKRGQSQIVLLDHGLYKRMPEKVRTFYCRIYRGFVTEHYEEIRDACEEIGIKDWKLLAFIVFMRPLDMEFFTSTGVNLTEAREILRDQKKAQAFFQKATADHLDEVMETVRLIPREFLLILRNNNIVRSINRELGSPVNRFSIFGRMAILGLKESSHKGVIARYMDYIYYEFKIRKMEFGMWIESVMFNLLYLFGFVGIRITPEGIEGMFEDMPFAQDNAIEEVKVK